MRMAAPARVDASAALATGALIGSLDIPRLRLSAMIAEGDDGATLEVAIGHLPDTALPWHDGNSAWQDIATPSSNRFNTSAWVTNCASRQFTATSVTRCERR
jgi:hypothetical protein